MKHHYSKKLDIPQDADSARYFIPEGYTAKFEDGVLIVELEESDDERIRKELIEFIQWSEDRGMTRYDFHQAKRPAEWIAYLEKQKAKERLDRMAPIYNDKESFESALEKAWKYYNESASRKVDSFEDDYIECVFSKGFREGFLYKEKQKDPLPIPDKFSGLKSIMLQYLQSAANRKDDTEIESDTDLFGRKILDYVWKYSDEQKERKPESISQLTQGKGVYKICPHCKERMVRDDSKVYTSMPPQYGYNCPKCGTMEFDTVMYDNPKIEEQKPAEWSDEDELMRTAVIQTLELFGGRGTTGMQIDWLKSLQKRFSYQTK